VHVNMICPTISVIILVHNNTQSIERCLKSIFDQNYPKDHMNVIVIGDSQAQITAIKNSIPHRAEAHPSIIMTILPEMPGAKRNFGVQLAKSEIVAFLDDDAFADENWLQNLLKHFKDPNVVVVGGPNLTPPESSFMEKLSGYILASFLGSFNTARWGSDGQSPREGYENDIILCNMAVRKYVFEAIGGFPPELWPAEENTFLYRVIKAGYRIIYTPLAAVYHRRRPLFMQHLKQVFRYGRGRGEMIRMFPASFRPLYFLPSVFLMALILGPIFFLLDPIFHMLYGLAFLLYFLLTLTSSLEAAVNDRSLKPLFILPIAFLLHHCAYGLGIIAGLFKEKSIKANDKAK